MFKKIKNTVKITSSIIYSFVISVTMRVKNTCSIISSIFSINWNTFLFQCCPQGGAFVILV